MTRYGSWFVVLTLIVSSIALGAEKNAVQTLNIGDPAPGFNLPGVDGRNYSLQDFNDAKILVVIFTCNHCPTAQAYEDRIKKLVSDYKDKGVAFVAISPNDPGAVRLDELGYTDLGDSFEDMKIRAKDREFNFPYLYDGETQEVSRAYGPTATPHVFVFDAKRKLCYVGRIDDSERENRVKTQDTRDALNALCAGKAVPVERTKAFGCSIKWANKRESVKESLQRWAAEEVSLELITRGSLQELIKNDSDKLRLVNVWATWCGPCIVEFPELVKINRMYRHRAFELITVSADDPDEREEVLSFLKKQEASCKNYLFGSTDKYMLVEAVDKEWSAALPYTILIRPGGQILYRHEGMIDPLELRRLIVKNLASDRR